MNLASLSNDVTVFYGKQLSFPGFISSQDEEGSLEMSCISCTPISKSFDKAA